MKARWLYFLPVISALHNAHADDARCDTIAPMDHALQREDYDYFHDWTDGRFDEAMRRAAACPQSTYKIDPATRIQDLAWMRAQIRSAQEADKSTQHNFQQTKETRIACERSNAYALFHAQEAVIDDREGIIAAKATIVRERRVGEISGAVDLSVQHAAGSQIIEWTEDLRNDFREYKTLGGSAATPATVTHKLPNPCADK